MDKRSLEPKFIFAALALSAVVVFLMVQPYLLLLILAIVLAIVFEPLHMRLLAILRSPSLSAFITTLVVLALVLLPLMIFGYQLVQEAAGLYGYLANRADGNSLTQFVEQAQLFTERIAPGLFGDPATIVGFVQDSLGVLLSNVGFIFAGFARIIVSFLLMLLVFFYLVRDGRTLKRRLIGLSPLSDEHETEILKTLERSVKSVVIGALVIALLQGLVAGIGFTLFGVPNPALWAGVLIIVSFIPYVGTSLVQIPIVAYMYFTGDIGPVIGLTVWAVLVVGLIDNVLRPQLVAKGTGLHPLVMLFAILGGITLFGPIGLIVGPIVMSLMLAFLHIWLRILGSKTKHSHKTIKIHS